MLEALSCGNIDSAYSALVESIFSNIRPLRRYVHSTFAEIALAIYREIRNNEYITD